MRNAKSQHLRVEISQHKTEVGSATGEPISSITILEGILRWETLWIKHRWAPIVAFHFGPVSK